MSFDSDTTDYEITYKRLEAKKSQKYYHLNEKASYFWSSVIEKDEADVFDVQFKAITFLSQWSFIRTAFRII